MARREPNQARAGHCRTLTLATAISAPPATLGRLHGPGSGRGRRRLLFQAAVPPQYLATAASLAGRQVAALLRLAIEDLTTARVLITVTELANAGFAQLNHSHTCSSANGGATHKDRDG
jgi:hypothetical protein